MPKLNLDIIIPTLNEEKNLSKIIPFLRNNTDINTKCYVVDSVQSTDKSYDFCNKNGINYIKSEFSRRSKQMNEGAEAGDGDILLFLHADVIPPPNFQFCIEKVLFEGYKAGFFSYKFDSSSFLLKINAFFTNFGGMFAGGGDQCQFFTRELFERYNGYKEDYEIMEDFEMIDRLKQKNERIAIIKNPAIVSARKYSKNSYLKVNYVNLVAFLKYKRKVSNCQVKEYYKQSLN